MKKTAYHPAKGPVVLCIMDGWGHRTDPAHNAVALANTPVFDRLWAGCPHSFLAASGADVGLPDGQVGNSEVGHMNIGAGRVVQQDLPRLNDATKDGSLTAHPALKDLASNLALTGGAVHVIGLVSPGGVHAHQDHMLAVIRGLADAGAPVVIHGFTDGRDVLPRDAGISLPDFLSQLPENATLGSLTGRYFGMDRDHRWGRTQKAYDAIALGHAEFHADGGLQALQAGYVRGESDEFLQATIVGGYTGMRDGDGLVMMNFRADRARQILDCFYRPETTSCKTQPIALRPALGMTSYSADLDEFVTPLYPPVELADTLGEVVAAAGRRQLRLAETEKYPHVTFFFNGGDETMRDGEDRALVPSPNVPTYDQLPQMSASGVLAKAVASLKAKSHDLLVINFANPDMVGHTGDLAAAITAVETVDACVGELVAAIKAADGQMLLTADHGNCEVMWDSKAESPHTAHTTNLVPLILVNGNDGASLTDGRLADLAPSLLAMMGIDQPASMTGKSLFAAV
ncbi:MAG: 2,3-bisphosphoglycerate-independent phosphoglycerate mutase [Proteobacteria bacterium]|nr:2,3-bisphosphoglycerate-independent phosphoglycerate mutase [Pseudomonadota bacterium]MDA0845120.1 2,3-bisphosphoglycerate-independent phosphoglycerate mutase [Pseudomonadota bacterium]